MDDDFHRGVKLSAPKSLDFLTNLLQSIPIPLIFLTLILGPLIIFLTAQLLLIGAPKKPDDIDEGDAWMLPYQRVPWRVLGSFFAVPSRSRVKYQKASEELDACNNYMLDEPHLSETLDGIARMLEQNIPSMISFVDTDIDRQPWEQYAQANSISATKTEIWLISLLRDMMGHTLVPAVYGHALMEKYPAILHDVYEMDLGRRYLLSWLPAWTPWPGVVQAHMARFKVLQCLDDHQKAIDATVSGGDAEISWGDLDDVSKLIMERNPIYKKHDLAIKERSDITILWALATNPPLIVSWQITYILSYPGLLDSIRAEISPYASVSKPYSIGSISEAAKLVLSHKELATKCPLLRSTYLETIRLADPNWRARLAVTDGIPGEPLSLNRIQRQNFDDLAFPEVFNPERFISTRESKQNVLEGKDAPLHKSNAFMERVCLSFVAGILAFWDLQPVEGTAGVKVPEMRKMGGIAVPASDVRVRTARRRFEWEG